MTSPEMVPPEMQELFKKFKEYQTTEAEAMKLAAWIKSMVKVPGFNYKQLCMAGYDYTVRDWNRLKKVVERTAKKLEVSGKTELARLETDDFAAFIEEMWKEAKNIATGTVMKWTERAKEYGYFDEEKGKVRMKDFIEDACNFYIDKKELMETVEDKVKDLEATCGMFAEISKPQVLRIVALRSYMEFVNKITVLAARGVPIPESIIVEVKDTVNNVILSTYQPLREAPNVE